MTVQEDHRVARAGAQEVHLPRGEVGTEIHVAAVRMVKVLDVVNDRTVIELTEKDRGAEAAVADDQVRLEIGRRYARLVNSMGVQHGIFKRPRAVVVRLSRPAGEIEFDAADSVAVAGGVLGDEN